MRVHWNIYVVCTVIRVHYASKLQLPTKLQNYEYVSLTMYSRGVQPVVRCPNLANDQFLGLVGFEIIALNLGL